MIYFRKSRQSGIIVFKVRADDYSLWSLQLLFDRPPTWSDAGDGKQQRGSRRSIFLFLQGFSSVTVSLCDQTRIPGGKMQPGYSTSGTLGLPAFNDMTNSIWIWCLMQTGDGAEAAARAAADSERLALLSYHKNSLFLPRAGICW